MTIDDIFAGNEPSGFIDETSLQLETENNIVVPVNDFNINQTVLNNIQETVDPMSDDGNHGIHLFLSLLSFFSE